MSALNGQFKITQIERYSLNQQEQNRFVEQSHRGSLTIRIKRIFDCFQTRISFEEAFGQFARAKNYHPVWDPTIGRIRYVPISLYR